MRHALALLLASGFALAAFAQQPAPPSPPTPVASPKPEPGGASVPRERERTIYVPFDELEKVFRDGGRGVFLPYKEFLELWNELTLKRRADDAKPPEDGVVSRAEYTGRVEGDLLAIDARITVESFKKGWITLPLAKGGTVPGVAEAETGTAVLWAKPDGYDVLLPDKGIYELKLKIHAPVRRVAGRQTVSLILPQAAVSRFTAMVPESGWEFKVEPAAAFTMRPAGAGTELSFFFGSGTRFDVSWGRPEAAVALTPLVLASSSIVTEVRSGSMATLASVDLRVLRAPVKSFSFLLPAGETVQSVVGDDVRDWTLEPAGDRQKLTVNPNAPVRDKWTVRLALESPLPGLPATVTVPEIVVEGATQDRGDISIAAEAQLDVVPRPGEDLVQQTQTVAPPGGLSAVGGYRFLKHPAKLALNLSEARPQIDAESLSILTVRRDAARVESLIHLDIRRVGVFEARVLLPSGWTAWEVVGFPADQWSLEKTQGGEEMVVRFPKQTLGPVSFSVRGQRPRAQPTEDAVIPVFSPQGVARHEGRIGVAVHSSLEVTTKSSGDLRLDDVGSLNLPPTAAPPAARQAAAAPVSPAPGTELTLAFRHRDAVKTPATLSFKTRDPQVNVEVLTLMEAREQSLRHTWTLAFEVSYAATDRFILAVPKAVAGDIRFADPLVKEIHRNFAIEDRLKQGLPDAAAHEFWEVVLRGERTGTFQLALGMEKPLAAGREARLELLQVHVPGAFQEVGQVAVMKDDNLEIRDSEAQNLEEIDPKELRAALARSGIFLAYQYKALPLKLALNVVKNSFIPVPQAVVTQAALTTAVSTDRAQTTEAIYWVRNNAQQFLTVTLPKGGRLVSDVFVDGGTQQPMHREGSEGVLIRLPAGVAATRTAFPVRFVFEVPSPKAGEKLGWWGSLSVEPPTLADVGVVMETRHALYLPERNLYTRFEGPMTQSAEDRGWARLRNVADALLPAFGPQTARPRTESAPVKSIPAQQQAAFDFQVPRQGQLVTLHRLGPPGGIKAHFRAQKVGFAIEAIAFLVTAFAGLRRWSRPLSAKVTWMAAVFLLAVISTGLLNAADARIAKSVLLALVFVAGMWFVLGVISVLRAIGARLAGGSSPAAAETPAHARPPSRVAETPPVPPAAPMVFPPGAGFSVWTEGEPREVAPVSDLEFPRLGGDEPAPR